MAAVTKKVEKKVARKAKVIKHTKKVESRAETLERKAEEAKRELLLLSAYNESRIQELERNVTTKAEVSREKYHSSCVDAFEAFEDGMDTLSWKHPAALGGQRIAKRNLTEKQLKMVNLNLLNKPSKSNGNYAGHSKEDQSLVSKVKYKNGDIGTAKRNEEMGLDLNPRIQEMCAKFPRFASLHSNREAFDILSQYNTGVSLDKVKNLLAVFCRTKDFRTFSRYLAEKTTAGIGGMEVFRILEDGTIVKLKGAAAAKHPNAGYRFVFKKGNKTKFDH